MQLRTSDPPSRRHRMPSWSHCRDFGRPKFGQPSGNEVRGALERALWSHSKFAAACIPGNSSSVLRWPPPRDIKGYTMLSALGREDSTRRRMRSTCRSRTIAACARNLLRRSWRQRSDWHRSGTRLRPDVPSPCHREPPRVQLTCLPACVHATSVAVAGGHAAAAALLTLGAAPTGALRPGISHPFVAGVRAAGVTSPLSRHGGAGPVGRCRSFD